MIVAFISIGATLLLLSADYLFSADSNSFKKLNLNSVIKSNQRTSGIHVLNTSPFDILRRHPTRRDVLTGRPPGIYVINTSVQSNAGPVRKNLRKNKYEKF